MGIKGWARSPATAVVAGRGNEWTCRHIISCAPLFRTFSPFSAMTTTTTYKGMDPSGRSSSRVLRPPGGGSNFTLGFDEPKEQPVRRNKMASSIFGTPEENPPSWARPTAKSSDIGDSSEAPESQRRNSTDANCGDCIDPKVGEVEVPENTEAEIEAALGPNEEKPLPAAPVPSPVAAAPAPSRRNPPGGKSSLVLG